MGIRARRIAGPKIPGRECLKARGPAADPIQQGEGVLMRTIGFISAKGGVAKTTTVINVSAGLARLGHRVLVVDTDPQGNASHVLLRGEKARRPTIAEVLSGDCDARDAIVPTHLDGVDVLPSSADLADVTATLTNEVGRERRLRVAMEGQGAYNFILVDCAPTRSIVTTNVLNYVGEVVVPITPGLFGVLGLGQVQEDVALVGRYLENKALRIAGILLTQVEKNNVHADVERQLREMFGPLVYATKIPRSIKIEEAHARHEPVSTYAPRTIGATAYDALTKEIRDGRRQANRDAVAGRDHAADDAA
jgi:chromosome partitioning protein